MKATKKILIGLLIGYLLYKLLSYFIVPAFSMMITPEQGLAIDTTSTLIGTIDVFISYFFNIVIGIILCRFAKTDKVLWFFMGGVFGISSLMLFLLLDVGGLSLLTSRSKDDK